MADTLRSEDIARLRALYAAARPAPWSPGHIGGTSIGPNTDLIAAMHAALPELLRIAEESLVVLEKGSDEVDVAEFEGGERWKRMLARYLWRAGYLDHLCLDCDSVKPMTKRGYRETCHCMNDE